MSVDEARLRGSFCDVDQGHVFRFWDDLSSDERQRLLEQLDAVELDRLQGLIERHLAERPDDSPPQLEPAEVFGLGESPDERARRQRWRRVGEEALARGELAVMIVAGGQATRLGFDAPKGTYPITPVTHKSLFQLHVEKVQALRQRFGGSVPLILLVAPHNHSATREFFERQRYFGLDEEDVWFVEQGVLPAVDRDGRLLLAQKGSLFLSPDGHGGLYRALDRSGTYERLLEQGARSLFYLQVDNPLVRVGDPTFLGMHLEEESQFSLKVCRKRDASEKVGVFARVNGHPGVVEYSDLPEEIRSREHAGELWLGAGSIGIHILDLEFMREVVAQEDSLPFHMARKRVPSLNDAGELLNPGEPNGLKFESFVFDALTLAKKAAAMEVRREEEFAPVKNHEGEDSPATALRALSELYRNWLLRSGISLGEQAGADHLFEIGPLFALDEQELVERIQKQDLSNARRLLFD